MTDGARWFVGIDWASETHQVCLVDARHSLYWRSWRDSPPDLHHSQPAGARVPPSGPIVETLLERGFLVYAIKPKATRPLP